MSEIAVIAFVGVLSVPITALITGLCCKAIALQALNHIKETQVIGGTPREVFEQKAEFDVEKRRQQLAAKQPKPIRRHGVVS